MHGIHCQTKTLNKTHLPFINQPKLATHIVCFLMVSSLCFSSHPSSRTFLIHFHRRISFHHNTVYKLTQSYTIYAFIFHLNFGGKSCRYDIFSCATMISSSLRVRERCNFNFRFGRERNLFTEAKRLTNNGVILRVSLFSEDALRIEQTIRNIQ